MSTVITHPTAGTVDLRAYRDCMTALASAIDAPYSDTTIAARLRAAAHQHGVHLTEQQALIRVQAAVVEYAARQQVTAVVARRYIGGLGLDALIDDTVTTAGPVAA